VYHIFPNSTSARAVPLEPVAHWCYSSRDIMPKRRNKPSALATPIQRPLFAATALLVRVPIGIEGHRGRDPHPNLSAAINALATLLQAKCRRFYQDRTE
jgi:hypothetical protein